MTILDGAVSWLGSQGLDQWAGTPWRTDELRPGLATGALRMAETAGPAPVPVATMTLGEETADFWRPADDRCAALYLSHLAVDRAFAGLGVGAWLLEEAAKETARRGKRWLRLDAWKSNARLHAYYRRQGFRLVRIDGGPGGSGALFERAVSLR
ncbi:GNAT superfamily N-acetyltransferase [Amycolatopsis lexingtonensis]|uniref:GNAT superfamily N-acetyltransferase n=1 Tax=Amycolatopsis lexingtonensis TaxID=218822 RepID=A0ABR9I2T2_9PSEU|nr:GNAT family N-acetyltransferase [Amycolatopsis lexingtonensis]MBE1497517.1 GNAT superfamily N-acetyltransferase [Amycolatopsis lexingtonensis]